MNAQLFPGAATITAGLVFASFAVQAQAASSDVSAARAECAQHKAKVHRLESRASVDFMDPVLIRARQDWEMACLEASRLMVKAGIESPPVQPAPYAEATPPVLTGPSGSAIVNPPAPVISRQPDQSIYVPPQPSRSVARYPTGMDPDSTATDPDGDGVPDVIYYR